MIRKNDPNSDFWQHAERVSRKVDGFPPWKLGRLEQMDFKVGDRVRTNHPVSKYHGRDGEILKFGKTNPKLAQVKLDSGDVLAFFTHELELVPELEQKYRFALEVADTEFITVTTLGPYVELSINDDGTIDLDPGQARRVAMMLLIAAEELEEE